jgi:hypothetical protein
VFAERGDPGGPPWYHNMYDWFQETTFSFTSRKQFDCTPNRGNPDAPMFLINHWITASPPSPSTGSDANASAVLNERVEECLTDRGLVPNILAVDFAERGSVVSTAQALNERRLREERTKAQEAQIPTEPPPEPGATPDPGQVTPLPEASVITTLTGGDPSRFCRVLPAARLTITAWAVAILQGDPAEAGLTDFAYAPALAQDVRSYVDAAPEELASRATPILDRARAAVTSLRTLGLTDGDIKRLAKAAPDALLGPDSPDGTAVRAKLIKSLEKKIDPEPLRQAAADFLAAQGDPTPLMDLGFVPQEVGIEAGYPCASERGTG